MKLVVRDISTSESHVTGTASIDSNLLWATFPFCSFKVCVDRVDGKSLEQYESELLENARERITEIYKEIVCDGEPGEAGVLLDYLSGKIEPTELSCKMKVAINDDATNKDLGERVALLEKRLSGKRTMHVSEKAVELYNPDGTLAMRFGDLNQTEKRLGGEISMRITSEHGQLLVHGERVSAPTYDHRNVIINKAIDELKSGHTNMLKRLGRCMGLLQVAAEIEAVNQLCGSACRENVLKDFDNPPFKNVPDDWISPGLAYLDRRV
ncbi:TPA: hypothetical protein P1843_002386 [Salmonella enterica subsp. enterica serovar Dublin]|nr:hypothetical protein [Salmonella enterica subsp. enterica serovar Dublin]